MAVLREEFHKYHPIRTGIPLHVAEITRQAKEQCGVDLYRESIVSALTKKVRKGVAFVRTGPNTFGIKER